jgi:hypothetical protein
MLVCAIQHKIVIPTTIYYKLWLDFNGTTVDTLLGSNVTISTETVIQQINYDFHAHYFAVVDLNGLLTNHTTIALQVG